MPKYARKVDDNQAEIVEGLRRHGYKVWLIGLPVDALVATKTTAMTLPIDFKNEHGKVKGKRDSKSAKTALQEKFIREWPAPVLVVWSLSDALEMLELYETDAIEVSA